MYGMALRIVIVRTLARSAAALAFGLLATGTASAQIVPETSGQPSAANSPAAVVQTGSRQRPTCMVCGRSPAGSGTPLVEAWLDEAAAGLAPRRPSHLR